MTKEEFLKDEVKVYAVDDLMRNIGEAVRVLARPIPFNSFKPKERWFAGFILNKMWVDRIGVVEGRFRISVTLHLVISQKVALGPIMEPF